MSPVNAKFLALLPALLASAAPLEEVEKRAACPNIHVFGARETTASPGYGSSSTVVNDILQAYSGSTAEAINYPACGGQSSCGGDSYSQSVAAGISAAASAVNSYNQQCPQTQLVLVGYSQGSEIFDAAFCGGGDPKQGVTNTAVQFSSAAVSQIKAAIFMGDPLYVSGLPYDVGTCKAGGFSSRPSGFTCPNASKIQSYCDASDPYCCNGNDANTHNGYGAEYGSQAFKFVQGKLSATSSGGSSGSAPSSAPSSRPTSGSGSGSCAALYGQCGGQGWSGPTCCASGTCKASNQYFSQCM